MSVKLWSRLKSTRLSAWLIAALLVVFGLGLVIPQRTIVSTEELAAFESSSPYLYFLFDLFGFFDIYRSPLTQVLLGAFFVNLLVVFVSRVGVTLERCGPARNGVLNEAMSEVGVRGAEDGVRNYVRARYDADTLSEDGEGFTAINHRYGPIGFLLFHFSFILLLAGAIMIYYTRSSAELAVAEGQGVTSNELYKVNKANYGSFSDFALIVKKIHPQYEKGEAVDIDVDVDIVAGDGTAALAPEPHTIKVNKVATMGSTDIRLKNIDIALAITVADQEGNVYEKGILMLKALNGDMDSYRLPYTSLDLLFTVYPDYDVKDGIMYSKSPDLANPMVQVALKDKGKPVGEGLVPAGGTVRLGNFNLTLEGVGYWATFSVVDERGQAFLIAGMALGVVGLVWGFFFGRSEVRGEVRDGVLRIEVLGCISKERCRVVAEAFGERVKAHLESAGRPEGE